jgi:hypothetical protein
MLNSFILQAPLEVLQGNRDSTQSEKGNALLALAQMVFVDLDERVEVAGVFPQIRQRYMLSFVHPPEHSPTDCIYASRHIAIQGDNAFPVV